MTDTIEGPVRRPHSALTVAIDSIIRLVGVVPYMIVALVLRLVVARPFFLSGQSRIDGPQWLIPNLDIPVTLPAHLRPETFSTFETALAVTGFSAKTMAYVVTYAEFALPILLVLGLATRFTALALIALMIFIDRYLAPDAFWSLHIYWYAILLVLMSCGAGTLSVDRIIRYFYDR